MELTGYNTRGKQISCVWSQQECRKQAPDLREDMKSEQWRWGPLLLNAGLCAGLSQ